MIFEDVKVWRVETKDFKSYQIYVNIIPEVLMINF